MDRNKKKMGTEPFRCGDKPSESDRCRLGGTSVGQYTTFGNVFRTDQHHQEGGRRRTAGLWNKTALEGVQPLGHLEGLVNPFFGEKEKTSLTSSRYRVMRSSHSYGKEGVMGEQKVLKGGRKNLGSQIPSQRVGASKNASRGGLLTLEDRHGGKESVARARAT